MPRGKKRNQLSDWFEHDLIERFAGRILAIDETVAMAWASVAARMQQAGKPLPVLDGLLAASAQQYDLTLVTRNVSDFAGTGVRLFNPWELLA
jgi:toxin FitB